MSCKVVSLPGGVTAIVRVGKERQRKCSVCGRQPRETFLCDFPPGATAKQACSAVLCSACRRSRGEIDYCPKHDAMVTPEGRLKL
jgi:hypothetical protein